MKFQTCDSTYRHRPDQARIDIATLLVLALYIFLISKQHIDKISHLNPDFIKIQ